MQNINLASANGNLCPSVNLMHDHWWDKIRWRIWLFGKKIWKSGHDILAMMRCCVNFDVIALWPIKGTQIIKPGNMVRMRMGNQYSVNFCQLMRQ